MVNIVLSKFIAIPAIVGAILGASLIYSIFNSIPWAILSGMGGAFTFGALAYVVIMYAVSLGARG